MKISALISALCIALILAACGSESQSDAADDSPIKTTRSPTGSIVREVAGTGAKPKIQVPPGPPPKNLVVRELKEGVGGAKAAPGDKLGVRFIGASYKTGKVFEDYWNPKQPLSFRLGSGEVLDGWETGLQGMKLGARRELILPSRLAYDTGVLVYVVELLEFE